MTKREDFSVSLRSKSKKMKFMKRRMEARDYEGSLSDVGNM